MHSLALGADCVRPDSNQEDSHQEEPGQVAERGEILCADKAEAKRPLAIFATPGADMNLEFLRGMSALLSTATRKD